MLVDTFGREIDYLRVSVTKSCNFRCQYCMPNTPLDYRNFDYLDFNKLMNFIKIAIDNGIKKIRITGGEPLLRNDLSDLLSQIYAYNPKIDLALTTNGFFLEKYAVSLFNAGLKRINVSLDSLKKERIILISKVDSRDRVINGLTLAKELGFKIKVNMVPMRGINDDEIFEMLNFCSSRGFLLRYIEFMENANASKNAIGLKNADILNLLASHGEIVEIEKEQASPARLYKLLIEDKELMFGIISPHDEEFCKSCNRIRLTSDGVLCPCLYHQDSVDLKKVILSENKEAMLEGLKQAIFNKPEKNFWGDNEISDRAFYETGG